MSDRLMKETAKFGGGSLIMWGCMLWDVGYACKIDGRMNGELYTKIMEDELQESLAFYGKDPSSIIFQQDNDPKHKSLKSMDSRFFHGQLSLHILIPLSTCGITSKKG